MGKMRTILSFLLAGTLALSLAACGGSNSSTPAAGAVVTAYADKSWANVTVASGDQQVTLTWTDTNIKTGSASSSTATTPQVTYNVYYSQTQGVKKGGAGVTKIANGSSTTFIHSGLVNGTTYYYVVTGVSADGSEGVESREASATPQAAILAAPTGITITAGDGQIILGTGFTNSPGVTYNVYWSTTTGVTKINGSKIPAVTFPLTHPSLVPGSTYYYVVTAQTASGESAESKQLAAKLLTHAAATAMTTNYGTTALSPSALAGDQQVTINWKDVVPTVALTGALVDPQTGATSYTLNWGTGGNLTPIENVTFPYPHLSLTNGTTYYYSVSAVYTVSDAAGVAVGTPTVTTSATVSVIPEAKAPATPSGLSAAAQPQQVQLSWKKDNSGDPVTYNLSWSTDLTKPWNKIGNISSNAFTHTGLTSGVTYYYKVSTQGATESAASNQISATP